MANDKPITLHEAAMRAGTLMGLFWIIKFSFIPLGFTIPVLHLLFIVCTLFVPFLGYIYAKRFRERERGGVISAGGGMLFCIMMYLSATMLAFVAHYIYFEYMDDGFIIAAYQEQMKMAEEALDGAQKESMAALIEQAKPVLEQLTAMSPIDLTFSMASQDITWCFILSIFTGLGIYKKKKSETER